MPGAIAAIRLANGEVHSAAAGLADVEQIVPMSNEHRLLTASIGKTFLSALCLRLRQQGIIDLDQRMSKWLGREPWFPRLAGSDDITLRMLLTHSSGIRDFIDEPEYAPMRAANLRSDWVLPSEGKLALVVDKPALFAPGQGYSYADTNYILAGMCIERATGLRYFELVARHFLRPLWLWRTMPAISRKIPGIAVGYAVQGGRYAKFGYPRRLVENGLLVYNPATEWTGGGFASNPADLVRWLGKLHSGEVLGPTDTAELWKPYRSPAADAAYHYGLGMYIFKTPRGPMIGHLGSIAGYSGFVMHLPWNQATIAMQANLTAFDRVAAQAELAEIAGQMVRRPGC